MDTAESELIGTGEAAQILELTPRQVLRILEPALKLPGRTGAALYDRKAVEKLAEERSR